MKIAILAGGSGTRLWPRSRARCPKQFLDLAVANQSLLQETVERVLPLVAAEDILIVTSTTFARRVAKQLPDVPKANILAEPCGRGSGPAIGWAAITIMKRWGNETMVSLHADHHVARPEIFRQALIAATQVAQKGHIVTLGVVPPKPHTGLGHVQRGAVLGQFNGFPVYAIKRFVEKPDLARATEYTASGDYYWNTGMFVWQTQTILQEIAVHMPDLAAALEALKPSLGTRREKQELCRVWQDLPVQQIDYGVMERTRLGAVVPVEGMGWNDVGDWDSLADIRPADANGQGNIVVGEFAGIDTSGCIIVGTGRRLIGTIGLRNMVVVETDDAVLVCPRGRDQEVRALVEQLRKQKKETYL